MTQKSSIASTEARLQETVLSDTDLAHAHDLSLGHLTTIEQRLGLQAGVFLGALRGVGSLHGKMTVAFDDEEFVEIFANLSEEDRLKCLNFARSLAKRN